MDRTVNYEYLPTFDHQSIEWAIYKSRLTQWFAANGIAHEKKKNILLSLVSVPTFRYICELVKPKRVDQLGYDALLKLLDEHLTLKVVGFADKCTFYSATQGEAESYTEWAARLRGLSINCEFKNLEEALLDRFIMGMAAGEEREALFVRDQRQLTLAVAVEVAESVRRSRGDAPAPAAAAPDPAPDAAAADPAPAAAATDDAKVDAAAADAAAVDAAAAKAAAFFTPAAATTAMGRARIRDAARGAAGPSVRFNLPPKQEKCRVCGFTDHKHTTCRYKSFNCKKCGNKGHLHKMCSRYRLKYIGEGYDTEDEADDVD